VAFKQVVGAKGDKGPLLSPHPAFDHQTNGGREIVVADAPGHASKVLKGTGMSVEKRLLLLARKGHDKTSSAVG